MDYGEEIPLNTPLTKSPPPSSKLPTSAHSAAGHRHDDEFFRNLVSPGSSHNRTKLNYCDNKTPNGLPVHFNDLSAMSVASLYDKDYTKEMLDVECDFRDRKRTKSSISELNEYDKSSRAMMADNDDCSDDADSPRSNVNNNRNEQNEEVLKSKNFAQNNMPLNPFGRKNTMSDSLFLLDGKRSIDFVLVWTRNDDDADIEAVRIQKRIVFEENLTNEGLFLEREIVEDGLHFVKIHAPLEVLRRYAEILKLRMPMKTIPGFKSVQNRTSSIYSKVRLVGRKFNQHILEDRDHFPKKSHHFTAVYSRDKEYLFDLQKSSFFSAAIRSRIVQFILDRKRFTTDTENSYAFGIDRLIAEEVYIAAYPLHDGDINTEGTIRNLLCNEWAAVSKWYRYQPLDYIKDYFGFKIGLYFAWLGYYTYMLMLASIVGVACFIYSLITMNTNTPSKDICLGTLNITMCPLCDHWCDYWNLTNTCMHVKVTYLFDNATTVFFAIFMSFWATLFLELWKRYSAEITHRWDLTGFDIHEEHPRPQYLARLAHVKKFRVDYVTNTQEPQPPFWRMKLPATVFSFSVVLLLIALAVAAVLGVVLYRMSMMAALSVYKITATSSALLFTTVTAASINLVLIFIFNWIYTYLAEYLTEFEILRTQTEFDDSLTLKIYLLQFVNYYASIFYIAFFKGKFIGYPGNYNRFFNFRQEECGLGGCLLELCIQLAIIMIGKQAFNTILEMILPIIFKQWNHIRVWKKKPRHSIRKDKQRWLRDLKLIEWSPNSLFSEYLEMVLQYGFVTIFVAAFPLAPFFALLNNILEMRLDAKKLLTFYRRPVTQRVRNIGVWYRILDSIGKLSVITNGFIIAFTSEFIPRLIYRLQISPDGSLNGYLNHSLAYFNTSDLQISRASHFTTPNVSICRYPDYREPPWSNHPYERTSMYWTVLASRLAFVVIFENIVAMVMIVVRWCIPDMAHELRDQIRREAYITNDIIIKQESMRAKNETVGTNIDENDHIDRESSEHFIKIEQLMNERLSGSQLDLVVYGADVSTPGEYTSRMSK